MDASKAAAAIPSKGLRDRITYVVSDNVSLKQHSLTPSSGTKGPKPATAAKSATDKAATRGRGRGAGRGGRGRNAGRPKAKTADELDAEMVDYFDTNATPTQGTDAAAVATNGTAQPTATLDSGMDEISVRLVSVPAATDSC